MDDLFGHHRWVLVKGLQSNKELNGKYAEVIRKIGINNNDNNNYNGHERFQVCVFIDNNNNDKSVLIKRMNMEIIPNKDTIKVCRLASEGEVSFTGGYKQTCRWPIEILRRYHNSMTATATSTSTMTALSPVSSLLGFPLRITKVTPRSKLTSPSDFDNQWCTYMMIDPQSGLAPPRWQTRVGPVIVWRDSSDNGNNRSSNSNSSNSNSSNIVDISSDDMCLFNDFLDGLLDQYSEGFVSPSRDLTPVAWKKNKARLLKKQKQLADQGFMAYNDINI